MGRHSAPVEPDDAPQAPGAVAVRERDSADVIDAGLVPVTRGRHSHSVDTEPPEQLEPPETAVPASDTINGTAPARPRPARPQDGPAAENDVTAQIPPVVMESTAEPRVESTAESTVDLRPAPATAPVSDAAAPSHTVLRGAAHNSAADLHLVRSSRGVLAMCAVAVVVPFVVEVVVLLVLGTLTGHSVLVWLWAPLVVAGVLLGVTLDVAHRRHTAAGGAAVTPPPVPAVSEL